MFGFGKMARLMQQFIESAQLKKAIRRNLAGSGYGI
jgi:hypothetical protein